MTTPTVTDVTRYLPRLRDWRNELVAWLGILASIALGAQGVIADVDLDSIDAIVRAIPALVGIVGRNLATGPRTAAALEAERVALLERVVELEADAA